jgi:hypothetical protein
MCAAALRSGDLVDDDGTGRDDRSMADTDARHDHGPVSEPDALTYHDVASPGQAGEEVEVLPAHEAPRIGKGNVEGPSMR